MAFTGGYIPGDEIGEYYKHLGYEGNGRVEIFGTGLLQELATG